MSILYEGIRQLIEVMYSVCGDYGIAIALITVIIRLCMIPLNRKQRQTMKQQQNFNLQVEEIKNKYKNNISKMDKELQKLYKKEGNGSMGCLLAFFQFPIMIVLYNGIRLAITADVTTVLLPWVPSLLARDSTYILPIMTVFVQIFPQIIPYISFFRKLNLTKMSISMILMLIFTNGCFAFMLPAGIELYYMISALFTLVEQVIGYIIEAKKVKIA